MSALLKEMLDAGVIYDVDGLYCGVAADGIEVVLGTVGLEATLDSYLEIRPSPSDW